MSEVNIPFDDAGSLEPLPGFVKRTVVLRAEELSKTYAPISAAEGRGGLELFRGLNLTIHAGEMVAIVEIGRASCRERVSPYV